MKLERVSLTGVSFRAEDEKNLPRPNFSLRKKLCKPSGKRVRNSGKSALTRKGESLTIA
jgi:hypothetical protein